MAFTVATQNTRRGAARLRLRGRAIATIVVRQEMPGIDRTARRTWARRLRRLMVHRWHRTAPGQLTTSGRRHRFRVVDHRFAKVHDGEAGVTPSRHIQTTVTRHRGGHRRTLGVVDVWPANGSWKPAKFRSTIAKRQAWHQAYMAQLRDEVTRLLAECDGVVVAGDFNVPWEVDLPGLRLVAKHGLDHIYASDSLRVRRRWLRLPNLGSDHRPVKARLAWRKR